MFNTDQFQAENDYFYDIRQQEKSNTNKRYKFFRQRHFTAGDVEQFLTYWDKENPKKQSDTIVNKIHPNCSLLLYHRLGPQDIFNTFKYIFNKFKKGIFLKVVNGEGKVFLPFSKIDYHNEWHDCIRINPRFKTIQEMMKYISELEGRPFVESRVHKIYKNWYGNNGLVRLEYPVSENDSGVNMLRDMFVTLLRERKVSSCELFINKRDFPILKKNGTEAYDNFFGKDKGCKSFYFHKYAPILSMTTNENYADIPIPTWEDWCRVQYYYDHRLFPKEFKIYPSQEEFDLIQWDEKIETAVFRGASTGLGTTIETNPRLFFSFLSSQQKRDVDGKLFLDVGITKWNLRPRMSLSKKYLDTIHINDLSFGLVEKIDPIGQAKYKYILHLPGHSMAYRLSLELMMGSVILIYPCEWNLWYSHRLKPYVHYIPLDPSKTDDIYNKIRWCKQNDDKCKIIAQNAREFAIKNLNREAILDYLVDLVKEISKNTGLIHHVEYNMQELIQRREQNFIQKNVHSYRHFMYENALNLMIKNDLCDRITRSLFYILMKNNKNEFIDCGDDKIQVISIGGKKLVKKKLKDLHEPSIGYMILNGVSEEIPNFIYTFHHDHQHVFLEYIEGPTFEQVLMDPKTTIEDIMKIFRLISLGIRHAQLVCGFMHMDLYPWNIIIKKYEEPIHVKYNIHKNMYIEVETNIIPVFIDYGRSHVVYRAEHFYNVSPFRLCTIQDIVSIVFSSLHIYLKKNRIDNEKIRVVFQMMKFFAKTSYMSENNLRSVSALKMFLSEKKKFSNMLLDSKNGLDHYNPIDFYRHIDGKFNYCEPIENRLDSYIMCPHLYNSIVCQIKFIEIFNYFDLDIDKEVYIKNILINLKNAENLDEDVIMWCRKKLGEDVSGEKFLHQFIIKLPNENALVKIPLLSTHPFVEHQIDQIEKHYGAAEWEIIFKMMLYNQVREETFQIFTKCFRNFWFQILKNEI